MTYQEAKEKSLTVRWKISYCTQGEKCWCRTIEPETPIMFKEHDDTDGEEYWIVGQGELNKETAEHIVKVHNESLVK